MGGHNDICPGFLVAGGFGGYIDFSIDGSGASTWSVSGF